MRYRPSLAFLLCLVPMLATGAVGGWIWFKVDSRPTHVRENSTFVQTFRSKEGPRVDRPPQEHRLKTQQKATALMEQLALEFPALQVESHPVPDDENGFLQLVAIDAPADESKLAGEIGLRLHDDSLNAIDGSTPWDAEVVRRLMRENEAQVAWVEHVSSLKTRSSFNMPDHYVGFVGARTALRAAMILLAKARLAADAHDESEALRFVGLASNLSSHFSEIEAPTLLSETVTVLLDLRIAQRVMTDILPALGKDADLPRWKLAVAPRDYSTKELARIMKGEWHTTLGRFMLPVILDEGSSDHPPDPEALARAYSSWFDKAVRRLPEMTLEQLLRGPDGFKPGDSSALSAKSQEIYDACMVGCKGWAKGYIRVATILDQHRAVLDLLILEKEGKSLSEEVTNSVTKDRVSGQAFHFNSATRELLPPDEMADMQVIPVKLPR
jgi:hypothetical protein